MKEEDSLAHQLEREQEAVLESAIQEEKSYLEEIEKEENTEIIVDTEPETESELGVSTTKLVNFVWNSNYPNSNVKHSELIGKNKKKSITTYAAIMQPRNEPIASKVQLDSQWYRLFVLQLWCHF